MWYNFIIQVLAHKNQTCTGFIIIFSNSHENRVASYAAKVTPLHSQQSPPLKKNKKSAEQTVD